MNLLDEIVDNGPVLSPELARPKSITKRQVERCLNQLSPHWDDEQLRSVAFLLELLQ